MRILSIDGGGIRGIIPGQVLVALEEKLKQLSGDSNMRIADAFDLIAGTSTGGILTCLYLCPGPKRRRPRFSAADAVNLYLQNGDDIFDVSFFQRVASGGGILEEKYSAEPLERVLRTYFGDLKLSQLLKPCLITSYDITRRQARFFNSTDVAEEGDAREFYVRDIARATSAAPTYFEPANIRAFDMSVYPLIDGGIFANNPALCAFVEAFKLKANLNIGKMKVLSLGTGAAEKAYHYTEARGWGKLGWALPALDIMMSGVAETVDFQLRTLFTAAKRPLQYLRLQLNLADFPNVDSAMDNASEGNMRALEAAGKKLAELADVELTRFAKLLLQP